MQESQIAWKFCQGLSTKSGGQQKVFSYLLIRRSASATVSCSPVARFLVNTQSPEFSKLAFALSSIMWNRDFLTGLGAGPFCLDLTTPFDSTTFRSFTKIQKMKWASNSIQWRWLPEVFYWLTCVVGEQTNEPNQFEEEPSYPAFDWRHGYCWLLLVNPQHFQSASSCFISQDCLEHIYRLSNMTRY